MIRKIFLFLFLGLISSGLVNAAEEVTLTTDSRIRTLLYNQNEVYQLKFHYGFQSYIEFAPDEEIEIISLGEAYPWKITPIGRRVFVRPIQIDVTTNMLIITTKRTYQFEITALNYDGKSNEDLVYSVKFFYPDKELKKPSISSNSKLGQPEGANVKDGFALSNVERGDVLNFNYTMAGSSKDITPIKVFDDGINTYFQFSNNNLIVPEITVVDIYGNETSVNYYIDGQYIAVKSTAVQFALRHGKELLCIFNNSIM